jgi:hypothetical protein
MHDIYSKHSLLIKHGRELSGSKNDNIRIKSVGDDKQ